MLKVLYAGSPLAACTVLERLLSETKDDKSAPYKITGVLTNPPSAQGRHKALLPTPVADAAFNHGIKVFTPLHLDAQCRKEVEMIKADILVCFAYGHIFGPKFLSLFPLGGVNLHPSFLPRYRGPTPVAAAILDGESETAVTIQCLALGMDEGDILLQERIALNGSETGGGLLAVCAERGAALLHTLLCETAAANCLPCGTPQRGEASYTKTITKEDARIDWSMSAVKIDAAIRAYNPAPCAWTMYRGDVLRIVEAKVIAPIDEDVDKDDRGAVGSRVCNVKETGTVLDYKRGEGIMVQTGDGILAITRLQKQGKKAMDASSFINGEREIIGSVLGR